MESKLRRSPYTNQTLTRRLARRYYVYLPNAFLIPLLIGNVENEPSAKQQNKNK